MIFKAMATIFFSGEILPKSEIKNTKAKGLLGFFFQFPEVEGRKKLFDFYAFVQVCT